MLPPTFGAATKRPSAVSSPPSSIKSPPAANANISRSISEGAPTFTFASNSCAALRQAACLNSDGPEDDIIFPLRDLAVQCLQAKSEARRQSSPRHFYFGNVPELRLHIVPFGRLDEAPRVLTGL